jgi:hypothetical protein
MLAVNQSCDKVLNMEGLPKNIRAQFFTPEELADLFATDEYRDVYRETIYKAMAEGTVVYMEPSEQEYRIPFQYFLSVAPELFDLHTDIDEIAARAQALEDDPELEARIRDLIDRSR